MRGGPVTYSDFSGGLNSEAAPYLVDERQARDLLNVQTTPNGSIKKRPGFTTHASSLSTITVAPHSLFPANLSTKSLIAVGSSGSADRIVKVDTAGTPTSLTATTFTNATRWWMAQAPAGAQGPIYLTNGASADTPQSWDGTTFGNWTTTGATAIPKGKFLTYHGGRLWMASDGATNTSRLFYSGITSGAPDMRNWDTSATGQWIDIEAQDGTDITGIGRLGPYLVVFKPRKTLLVYDLVTPAYRAINTEIGCVAPRSIVETPAGTLFLSEDVGVCSANGRSVERISRNVMPQLRTAASSPTTMANACATFNDHRYQLSFSYGGTRNDRTLEYDLDAGAWYLHDCASNQFALLDPQGSPVLYSANPAAVTTQKAFVTGTYTDAGSAYVGGAYWTFPYMTWGSPHIQKGIRAVRADGVGTWAAAYAIDFKDTYSALEGEVWDSTPDSGGTFGGSGSFGGSGTFGPAFSATTEWRYYTPEWCRAFAPRFMNADANDWQLRSMTVALQNRRD